MDWRTWFDELVGQGRAVRFQPAGGPALWVAAERWPLIEAVFPEAKSEPPVALPVELRCEATSTEATQALVRGRMEICGPTTAREVAEAIGLRLSAVEAALEALEGQGAVLRGQFNPAPRTSGDGAVEWCDRRLLARIHRLTLESARRRVQPTSPRVFWRFLCELHGLGSRPKLSGRQALRDVVSQLQGCELAGGAWESDVLPGRIGDYDPAWLDDLALSGELAWGRLAPPRKLDESPPSGAGVTRVVPLSLMQRTDLVWLAPLDRPSPEQGARGAARLVYETLTAHGALFFDDLLLATGLLRAQLEDALSELAALGAVSSDSFSAIRRLTAPEARRKPRARRKNRRAAASRAGRWSRFPAVPLKQDPATRLERWAWQLLRRWGVVFRDLLARETVAPAWRELVPVYRRLEAQGKVRGGRFVSGVSGEQYAAPEAVERLRKARDADETELSNGGEVVFLSAADPLNLFGVILGDERVPAIASNALAAIDGRLVAAFQAGQVRFLEDLPQERRAAIAREIQMNTVARRRRQSLDDDAQAAADWPHAQPVLTSEPSAE